MPVEIEMTPAAWMLGALMLADKYREGIREGKIKTRRDAEAVAERSLIRTMGEVEMTDEQIEECRLMTRIVFDYLFHSQRN